MAGSQTNPIVDATIRQYLIEKVRERFIDDYHLIEPMIGKLVERYSIKELFIICSVEINRIKLDQNRGRGERPEMG